MSDWHYVPVKDVGRLQRSDLLRDKEGNCFTVTEVFGGVVIATKSVIVLDEDCWEVMVREPKPVKPLLLKPKGGK